MLVRRSILSTAKKKKKKERKKHVLTEHQRIQPTELKSSHKMGGKKPTNHVSSRELTGPTVASKMPPTMILAPERPRWEAHHGQ